MAQRVGLERPEWGGIQTWATQSTLAAQLKEEHISPETKRPGVRRNKCTQALQHRGQALGTETSTHKLCNTQGELRGPREDHTSLCNAKATRQDTHKHQPSKLRPAVQGRTREYEHRQWSQRQVGYWRQWRYAERATFKQLRKLTHLTLPKPEGLPKDMLKPQIPQNLLLYTALPLGKTRSSPINQNTDTSSPNQKKITGC